MAKSSKRIPKVENPREALKNKNIVIIGGTSGIGKALATSLLALGASVVIVGRRTPDESLAKAKFIAKDLSLMKNARSLGQELSNTKIDILVFTNGIMASKTRQETPEGIELDLAVSYLSRVEIVNSLTIASNARVFVMGFPGQKMEANFEDFNSEKNYAAWPAHMQTVIGNEALVEYCSKRHSVNVYGLNPGLIRTEIRQNFLGKGLFSKIVESLIGVFNQSAQAYSDNVLVHLLASPELESKSGCNFDNAGVEIASNPFLTNENRAKILVESQKLIDKALAS